MPPSPPRAGNICAATSGTASLPACSFSGYFCACGKSGISFLHNSLSILLVRVPGAYLASKYFPQTLLPMGLANAAGSLFSILVCVVAYAILTRREKRAQEAS